MSYDFIDEEPHDYTPITTVSATLGAKAKAAKAAAVVAALEAAKREAEAKAAMLPPATAKKPRKRRASVPMPVETAPADEAAETAPVNEPAETVSEDTPVTSEAPAAEVPSAE